MKLKYKKMIIMISMCTMGIGMVTFSMSNESKGSTTEVEASMMKKNINSNETSDSAEANSVFSAAVAMISPVPTETPVVEELNPLVENTNEEITTLVTNYLNAKLTNEADSFKDIVNDVSLIDSKALKRKTKYIEQFKNLSCYTKKGPEEGSYIVYACHEVKIIDIDTLAPAMDEFYVKTNEKGQFYIYLGEIDDATGRYLNEARESEDVLNLIYSVNEKLTKARESDTVLDQFNKKLEEATKNVTKK